MRLTSFMDPTQCWLKQEIGEDEVDFPFRVSPSELTIIENDLDPPCSTVR